MVVIPIAIMLTVVLGTVKGVPWSGLSDGDAGAQTGTPMLSSVAKVVQPTATVSSVPVCAPSKCS